MKNPTHFYVVVPLGLEELCAQELEAIGITNLRVQRGAVTFGGSMLMAQRACLYCRTASRILMRVGVSDYQDEEDIYNFACRTKWENWFGAGFYDSCRYQRPSFSVEKSRLHALAH